MQNKAVLVIDIQNDITKNYKEIINTINEVITWADKQKVHVIYLRQEYLSEKIRKFKSNTPGAELTDDLKVVSKNVFTKNYGSALSSPEFEAFIKKHTISEFYLTGADAVACVKATNNGLRKAEYTVKVITDCVTSYDKRKIDEMFDYYKSKGSELLTSQELFTSLK